jgi:hypothetical protein
LAFTVEASPETGRALVLKIQLSGATGPCPSGVWANVIVCIFPHCHSAGSPPCVSDSQATASVKLRRTMSSRVSFFGVPLSSNQGAFGCCISAANMSDCMNTR